MKEVISYNSGQIVRVTEEVVSGVLLDFKALTSVPAVCVIADLNVIPLKISVKRHNQPAVEIVENYLDYILRAYHSGTPRYDQNITARSEGYLIKIPFEGDIDLRKGDELTIEMKAPTSAFTSFNSGDITIETFQAPRTRNNFISVARSFTYSSGADEVDQIIGHNVVKAVLVHDLTADYDASTKAKPTNGIILEAAGGYSKKASENLLFQENLDYLSINPDTDVQDLVIYNNPHVPLTSLRLKAKYNKAVDNAARVMTIQRIIV